MRSVLDFFAYRVECLRATETRHTGEKIARWRMVYVEHVAQAVYIYTGLWALSHVEWWLLPMLEDPLLCAGVTLWIVVLFELLYDHAYRSVANKKPPSWNDSFWDVLTAFVILLVVLPWPWNLVGVTGWAVGFFVCAGLLRDGGTFNRPRP